MFSKLLLLSYLNVEAKVLDKASEVITFAHFRFIPTTPSQDTFNDIVLESLIRLERKLELMRHNNFRRSMEAVGEDYQKYE